MQARVINVQARDVSVQARVVSVQGRVVSVQARVIRRGRVLETMGCYLADYRVCVGTWAARISCVLRTSRRTANENGHEILCLGTTILCATTLAVLLVIGGVEENPVPGV